MSNSSCAKRAFRVAAAAVTLGVAGLLLVLAAPARADDTQAPQVSAFHLTPLLVDTSLSDQAVTVTLTISDAQTGVHDGDIGLKCGDQYLNSRLSLVSGDRYSGVWTATVTMPRGSAAGVWTAWVCVIDYSGNSQTLGPAALAVAFGAGCAEVTNIATFFDTVAPQVTAFSLTPHTVNTSVASEKVTVAATVGDDWSGVANVQIQLKPSSGTQIRWANLTRVSGDALSGTYSCSLTLPSGSQAGEWKARLVASDGLGNSTWLYALDLDARFGAGSAVVTNAATTWDGAPPQITSLSITPTEVNTESAGQVMTVTATLTDDRSGVENASVSLRSLIGMQELWTMQLTRASGSELNGVYRGSLGMPVGAKEGLWTADFWATDKLGNQGGLDSDQLRALLPDAVGLIIVNTASAQEVTIDRRWTIDTTTSSITFPAGTVVTRQSGGRFAFYELAATQFKLDGSVPTTGLSGTPVATLQLGIPGLNLSFSQPVTVAMEVGSQYKGCRMSIWSLAEGAATWMNETTSTVVGGRVSFKVNHATKFVVSIAPPSLTRFAPSSGLVGSRVALTGSSLTGATSVAFNGTPAVFTVKSDAKITATVPSGARSGVITVTTPGGTYTSATGFIVTAPARPRITRLSPTAARHGAIVTIAGKHFGKQSRTSFVKFGATKCAKYVSWSTTRIKCRVPAKARFGSLKVRVTTEAGLSNAKTYRVKR